MKRAARLKNLPLAVNRAARAPLWRQVSVGLRAAVATGRLRPGARLPSTRALARRLGVSRNTVMAAYDELAARGLLVGLTGAGSYVAPVIARPSARTCFEDPAGNRLTITTLP